MAIGSSVCVRHPAPGRLLSPDSPSSSQQGKSAAAVISFRRRPPAAGALPQFVSEFFWSAPSNHRACAYSTSSSSRRNNFACGIRNLFSDHHPCVPGCRRFYVADPGRRRQNDGDLVKQQRTRRRKRVQCNIRSGSREGSLEWMMARASPYEVLGVSAGCSEDDIKSAFRARVQC